MKEERKRWKSSEIENNFMKCGLKLRKTTNQLNISLGVHFPVFSCIQAGKLIYVAALKNQKKKKNEWVAESGSGRERENGNNWNFFEIFLQKNAIIYLIKIPKQWLMICGLIKQWTK